MGAANMPLIPIAVATSVAVVHCLLIKHCLYPPKAEDKSIDSVTSLARIEDNVLLRDEAIIVKVSEQSADEILAANNVDSEAIITVTTNTETANHSPNVVTSIKTTASISSSTVTTQPDVDYVYYSSFGKKAPINSFNVPYDTWEGGGKLMYKDLPLFVAQYDSLPRRGILDIELSVEDSAYFNKKLTPIINCFFAQEQPFMQPVLAAKWEKILASSTDPAVTPKAFSKLKLAFWDDVLTTHVAPYTHKNLYRLYGELDE